MKTQGKGAVRLIVDLNAVLNAALLGGKDPDGQTIKDENGKSVQVNSALYGVERFFDYLVDDMKHFGVSPRNVLGVWDGQGAKQYRQVHLEQYKQGREKNPAVHEQLSLARAMVADRMKAVGITTTWVKAREADDVIAYLVRELRDMPNFVSTVDGDLNVLVDPNTHVWRLGKLNENPYGAFPHRFITLYKALVGDTSDGIPGAKGFGDAAFVKLVRTFGMDGLDAFVELIENGQLSRLQEDVADMKELQKVIDSKDLVATCWRVAKLHPEDVNTKTHPLEWDVGMVQTWSDETGVPSMKHWYGTKTLVTSINYDQARRKFQAQLGHTPFVALDIETSSCEASDEWMDAVKKRGANGKIDALGHNLTGMSITFGDNCQHTVYMSVDHADTANITVDQCREMVEQVPGDMHIVVHNFAFEGQILFRTWGEKWVDNGWHGFLSNTLDTIIGASYVNENLPRGLKLRSKTHLGYEQQTYEDVTTMEGPLDVIPPGGEVKAGPFTKVIKDAVIEDVEVECEWVDEDTGEITKGTRTEQELVTPALVEEGWYRKQYKMNQLTGRRVLNYGCDDTICTAALHNWFYLVMQIEHTWDVYMQVEQVPAYLTILSNLQGARMSMERLIALETEDKAIYEGEWAKLREFLFTKGWAGTRKPVFTEVTTAAAKEACEIVLGEEFTTRKKKLPAVAADMREAFPDNDKADLLANIVEKGDVELLNDLVAKHFTGEPKINFDSPRQVQKLLYGVIGMTPRIYNKLTAKEKQDEAMRDAFSALRRLNQGRKVEVTDAMREMWMKKATTDDQSVELALVKDEHLSAEDKAILKSYLKIKEVTTRLKMFYRPYRTAPHWRDGLIHSSMIQCEAVTRRYSSREPNLQQLPSRGEGIKFRTLILPHHDDAIFVSTDFSSQELRGLAHASKDEGMLSCYLGDKPKDIHSLVAVEAAPHIWGEHITYDEFMAMRKSKDEAVAAKASALRGKAKTCVFGSNYGAQAANLALQLQTDEGTAQKFLDALDSAFPRVKQWKREVVLSGHELGYSTTFMGARRHLNDFLRSTDHEEVSKAERQLCNAVIQSSGAEQVKLAMARLWEQGTFMRYDARFFAPIHDELCASVSTKDAADFILEMHAAMIKPYGGMVVPAASSLAIGLDFSCPLEIGENPTRESIEAAIKKLKEAA